MVNGGGQSAKYSEIVPTIAREAGYIANEYSIYREILNVKKESDFATCKRPIEYLAKMQHYGFPTRLVDFTVNPLVALYFGISNINLQYGSNIYVFKSNVCGIDSEHVNLLSLLPSMEDLSYNSIQQTYSMVYGTEISIEAVNEFATMPAFIQYTSELWNDNPRIQRQSGTFAICANRFFNNKLQRSVRSLDTPAPYLTIHIPYEYKSAILHELRNEFEISDYTMYPELTSFAGYINTLYKISDINYEGSYKVYRNSEDILPQCKRIDIDIYLEQALNIDQIKVLCEIIMEDKKRKYDVILLSVARNAVDCERGFYVLQCQWIVPSLEPTYTPVPINIGDPEYDSSLGGYYWSKHSSYESMSNIFAENTADRKDADQLIEYHAVFLTIYDCFFQLKDALEFMDLGEFRSEVESRYNILHEAVLAYTELPPSKNKKLNSYLKNYLDFAISLDNIRHFTILDDCTENWIEYRVSMCFSQAKKNLERINKNIDKWCRLLNVQDVDINSFDPKNIKKLKRFGETKELNPNPLMVNFDVAISISPNKHVIFLINTNLFLNARIGVRLETLSGQIIEEDLVSLYRSEFSFNVALEKMEVNEYRLAIFLSHPRKQPGSFIDKAGSEYENLGGALICRYGLNSTLEFYHPFNKTAFLV